MILVYLAGKYSADTTAGINDNIAAARKAAIELWEKGYAVICPHLNTQHFEVDCSCDYEDYMRGDFEMIKRVDALVMLPGWRDSKGAVREHELAVRLGKRVTEYPALPYMPSSNETHSQKAERIVKGARQQAYGHPRDDFARTAALWSGLLHAKLNQSIGSEDVALMMVCLKLSRLIATPHHDDSLTDAHGYLATYEMLHPDYNDDTETTHGKEAKIG